VGIVIDRVEGDLASDGGMDLLIVVGVRRHVNHFPARVEIEIGESELDDSAERQTAAGRADEIHARVPKRIRVNDFAAVGEVGRHARSRQLPAHARINAGSVLRRPDDFTMVVNARMRRVGNR
jgi:hypothetical protein